MSFLLVGGDSEIASATFAYMQRHKFPVVATTRRAERLAAGRISLDLAPPLAAWRPPSETRAACILAAVGHLVDCHRDPVGSALINVTRTLELVEQLVVGGIRAGNNVPAAGAEEPMVRRLSAGGRWIRTLGPPVEDGAWACFGGATASSGGPIEVRT
jgi:hypothetical protein